MATTTKNELNEDPNNSAGFLSKIWTKYLAYAEQQGKNRMLWYALVLLVLPCGVMMPMAILMMFLVPGAHTIFIGLLILLLFSNVVLHVAQVSPRLFVPAFHATIALMTLIPLITYLTL